MESALTSPTRLTSRRRSLIIVGLFRSRFHLARQRHQSNHASPFDPARFSMCFLRSNSSAARSQRLPSNCRRHRRTVRSQPRIIRRPVALVVQQTHARAGRQRAARRHGSRLEASDLRAPVDAITSTIRQHALRPKPHRRLTTRSPLLFALVSVLHSMQSHSSNMHKRILE